MKAYKDPTADQAISEADKWEKKQRDLKEQHRIHRGDTITIRVAKREGVDGALVIRDVKTIVKALYPHVVELRLPGGLTRSPTYWELAKMRVGGGSSGSQDNQGAPGQLSKNKKGDPNS